MTQHDSRYSPILLVENKYKYEYKYMNSLKTTQKNDVYTACCNNSLYYRNRQRVLLLLLPELMIYKPNFFEFIPKHFCHI